jgi:hypothetical protein
VQLGQGDNDRVHFMSYLIVALQTTDPQWGQTAQVMLDAVLAVMINNLAANYPTTIDPFSLLTLTRDQVSILVTEFCFKLPVIGHYLRAAGHIPVVHSNGRSAFDEAVVVHTDRRRV